VVDGLLDGAVLGFNEVDGGIDEDGWEDGFCEGHTLLFAFCAIQAKVTRVRANKNKRHL
jgi:hypothetical protein